jgi:hypothetical protein
MPLEHHKASIEPPTPGSAPGGISRRTVQFLGFVALATAALLLARIPLLPHRSFDPDELEHSHAAWSIFKGMLPYRDFFEHHTPWYYYALRPFFNWLDVDVSFENARHFLIVGRGLSLALTVVSVLLVWWMGELWRNRRVGWLAGLLLVAQPIFLQKTLEIRPDVLALPFFLGGLGLLLRALARGGGGWWFLAAGSSMGAAIMCTQKMLFVLPGTMVGLGLWSIFGAASRKLSMLAMLMFVIGICIPAVLTWGAFIHHDASREFIANNFLLNARWKHVQTNQLLKLIVGSWPVLALSIFGVFSSLSRFFRSQTRPYADVLLSWILGGLFAGVLVVPVAHRQYYLMPLPIVCLFAAQGLFVLFERARDRRRVLLVTVASISLTVLPLLALREAFQSRNDQQLARLRQVFETTKPTDLVMDGWAGMGVFRPHAFFYFFLHEESRAMLPRAHWDTYLDALESGRIRPALIAMDQNLAALGPRFLTFVKRHYVTSDGFFYFRSLRSH